MILANEVARIRTKSIKMHKDLTPMLGGRGIKISATMLEQSQSTKMKATYCGTDVVRFVGQRACVKLP